MKLFSALEVSPTQKRAVIDDLNPGVTLRDERACAASVELVMAIAPIKSSRRVTPNVSAPRRLSQGNFDVVRSCRQPL